MTAAFGPRFTIPILLGPALNALNTTMIAVALVPIAEATRTSTAGVVWLVIVLYAASAIAQPLLGRLADIGGARAVCIGGMALAGIAGLAPLVEPSFAVALVARVGIGIGTAAAYPASMAAIAVQAERVGREPPKALFSALSVASLSTAAVGPVLGGVLVDAFGWQAIFVVNAPYAMIVIVVAALGIPRGRASRSSGTPTGRDATAAPRRAWGALARTYARLFLVYAATYVMIYGFIQWMQAAGGYSASAAGWVQVPAVVIAGLAAAALARTRRVRAPLVIAAAVPVCGGILVVQTRADTATWLVLVTVSVFGLAQGLASVSNQVALYRQAPRARLGLAAGLSRTAVQAGAVGAAALVGTVFGARPSDAGLHLIGVVIIGLGVVALVVTGSDRALSRVEDAE